MPDILLVTGRPQQLADFAEGLRHAEGVSLTVVQSAAGALAAVRASAPQLVVIDNVLPDGEPKKLVVALLQVDAMINTAVVSRLPEAEFHEASEGLGVMARLPDPPGAEDVPVLLEKLAGILPPG